MVQILLLFSLTSIWTSAVKAAPTFYEKEEDDNLTIAWDSQVHTDLSHINMICWFLSKPLKVLYKMINSVEVPESQHQQFAGRVQMDRDVLREGRTRLQLSTLRTEDSGNYTCDMAANYDNTMRRWAVLDSVHMVLNVKQVSLSLLTPGQTVSGATQPEQRASADIAAITLGKVIAVLGASAFVTLALVAFHHRRNRVNPADLDEVRRHIIDLLLYISTREVEDREFLICSNI